MTDFPILLFGDKIIDCDFLKKSSKRTRVCREPLEGLTVREKGLLGFVPECGLQMAETSSEPEEREDVIV
jgi:hypothetical protein